MENIETIKAELEKEKTNILEARNRLSSGGELSEKEVGLDSIGVSAKELEAAQSEADQVLSEIKKLDISEITDSLSVSETLDKLLKHSESTNLQVQNLSSDIGKRTFVGLENSKAKEAIDSLKETLIEFDPSKFKLSEPDRWLGFLPIPDSVGKKLRSYMRKFKESESHLQDIVTGVIDAKNESIASLESINKFNLSLIKVSRDLKKQYLTYKKLQTGLTEHIAELKEVDPQQAKFLEREVLSDVTTKLRDTLETITYARLGIVETEVLGVTQKTLINELGRMVNSGRLILTIGQNIAISLHQQRETTKMIVGIQATLQELTEGTAQELKEHARETSELARQNIGSSPEALSKAFESAYEALNQTTKTHEEMLKKAKQAIADQERIMAEVDKKAVAIGSSSLASSSLDDSIANAQAIRDKAQQKLNAENTVSTPTNP